MLKRRAKAAIVCSPPDNRLICRKLNKERVHLNRVLHVKYSIDKVQRHAQLQQTAWKVPMQCISHHPKMDPNENDASHLH